MAASSVTSLLPTGATAAIQTVLAPAAAPGVGSTLRETLDHLLEGFQIVGRDWTYLYVNPAAARHGRRRPEELHGRAMWEVYPGIDETPIFDVLRRCMAGGQAASLENLFSFPDGGTRWFEVRVEPIPEGVCIHSVDIQDRKDAEAALREQESVARLGQMAAVVAHEVKNPLAGLYGALQVLRARRQPPDPEGALFDQMMDRIRSLNRLIQDLLVFARPMQLQRRSVPVGDLVHDARLLLENDPDVQRHTVDVSSVDPAPVVSADRELMRLVLQNLLLNAAQAMRHPGTIAVGVTREGPAVRVTVTDSGGGVPPEIADRIFEPFVTTKNGGTGLGLAVSRRIARLHGGDLDFAPAPGTGTTFRLTIPLLDN